jgi:hypothetical protein
MQEVLYFTYTGNFFFWILLPGREIYFLGLPIAPPPKKKTHTCIHLLMQTFSEGVHLQHCTLPHKIRL